MKSLISGFCKMHFCETFCVFTKKRELTQKLGGEPEIKCGVARATIILTSGRLCYVRKSDFPKCSQQQSFTNFVLFLNNIANHSIFAAVFSFVLSSHRILWTSRFWWCGGFFGFLALLLASQSISCQKKLC